MRDKGKVNLNHGSQYNYELHKNKLEREIKNLMSEFDMAELTRIYGLCIGMYEQKKA